MAEGLDDWYDIALQEGKGFKSSEERQAYLDSLGDPMKHPMFAQNSDDLAGHPLVEAIRALKEDDKTPFQLAEMYKDEGNEWIKKSTVKNQKEAYTRYTIALDHIKTAESSCSDENIKLQLPILKSQILSNRALSSINLKNYGSCRRDADLAISIWSKNIKAHHRKCKALLILKKYSEAISACETALACETVLLKFEVEVGKAKQALRTRWMEVHVAAGLGMTSGLRDPWELLPRRDPDTLQPVWSMVFLYPDCNSDDVLAEHVCTVLPEQGEGQ
eukprot:gene8942-18500_t